MARLWRLASKSESADHAPVVSGWARISAALVRSSNGLSVLMLALMGAVAAMPLPVIHDLFKQHPLEAVASVRPSDLVLNQPKQNGDAVVLSKAISDLASVREASSHLRGVSLRESHARFQRARALSQKFAAKIKARDGEIMPAESDQGRAAEPESAVRGTPEPSDVASPSDGVTNTGIKSKLGNVRLTVEQSWTAEEISSAREECRKLMTEGTLSASDAAPIREGACGAPAPIAVRRIGAVHLEPAATMNCRIAAGLLEWLKEKVQPAATAAFGVPVVRLISASSYNCRNRNGQPEAPLSEHAHANAIDIAGFVLADGRSIKVVDGWGATERDKSKKVKTVSLDELEPPRLAKLSKLGAGPISSSKGNERPKESSKKADQAESGKKGETADARATFLRKIHTDACGVFGTVLGPEANEAHRDHLHLDMKDRRRQSFCQ